MPYTTFRCRVSAAPATIWAVLLEDLAKQAGEELGIEPREAERLGGGHWKIAGAIPDGAVIHEVTADPTAMRIDASLVERPRYTGTSVIQIVAPHWRDPDRRPTLSTSVTWQLLDPTGEAPDMRGRVRDDVHRVKKLAEKRERRRIEHEG